MKILLLVTFLLSVSAFSQSSSSLELDEINLDGTIKRESIESKLLSRRQRLERQTMKKLLKKMEIERIKNEIRLSRKLEKAMTDNMSNVEME